MKLELRLNNCMHRLTSPEAQSALRPSILTLGKVSSRWETLAVAAVFCFFLTLYGFSSRAAVQVSDEAAMLATGAELSSRGVLYIDNLEWLQEAVNIGQRGVGGHLYAKYFPGNVFASALLYRLAAYAGNEPYVWGSRDFGYHVVAPSTSGARFALRLNALLGAIGMTMLFVSIRRRRGWRTAAVTVLLIGLGSDWWYQSRGFFSEVGAGAFMMAALCFADVGRAYSSSAALAISILFRPTNLLAAPIWLYSLSKQNERQVVSGCLLLAAVAALADYNWIRFGSPMNFGYGSESFTTPAIIGLLGLLISPGRSLFLYSPVLLLAALGVKSLDEHDRKQALVVLFIAVAYLLAAASWQAWWGGKAWGSRLLTPIIPLIGLFVAAPVDRALRARPGLLIAIIAVLGLAGLSIQLLTLTQNPIAVLDFYLNSGYSTYAQSIMSLDKNWLALQIKNVPNATACTIDAYSIRALFSWCR